MTHRELKELRSGELVKLKRSYENWLQKEAFWLNSIGDKLDELHAPDYFLYAYIGAGFPYLVQFIEYRKDVGEGPGALIRFILPNNMMTTCLIDKKDIKRV